MVRGFLGCSLEGAEQVGGGVESEEVTEPVVVGVVGGGGGVIMKGCEGGRPNGVKGADSGWGSRRV